MDRDSLELAQAGVRDYAEVGIHRYAMLREMLQDALPVDIRAREVMRRSNLQLLKGFVEQLPTLKHEGVRSMDSFIPAEDPYIASQVQANVMWLEQKVRPKDRYGTVSPYYIIGQKPDTAEQSFRAPSPASKLLLFAAVKDRTEPLRSIKVWDSELKIARDLAEVPMTTGYTDWEMSRLYHPTSNTMRIREDHGSMATKPANENRLNYPSRFKDRVREIGTVGINAQLLEVPSQHGIDDAELATYDVFAHLNRLAVAFDKTAVLHDALESYKNDTSTN